MHSSRQDLPIVADMPEATLRQIDWAGMTVETGEICDSMDTEPLFRGLPDNRCQSPHWGYVLKGRLRYKYADHEEVYDPGHLYYAAPGHIPIFEPGSEYVEFSPTDKLRMTMEVVERNVRAMQ